MIRVPVEGIRVSGRNTQGVKVMNIKDDDRVSAVALVVESEDNSAPVDEDVDQIEIDGEAPPSVDGDGASAGDNGASPDVVDDE